MEHSMTSLSYQEKSLYGSLIAELIFFGVYFAYGSNTRADLGRLTGIVILLIIVQIIYQIVLAIASSRQLTDERDRLIAARGYRAAYFALVTGLMAIAALLLTNIPLASMALINVILAALVIAEIVKVVTQLISYKTAL
jgi:FtsH-binding integral membrane protein